MKIEKEILAQLEMVYSISLITVGGRQYCISASEARDGKVALIDCLTKRVRWVEGLSGGVMCLEPVPGEDGLLYAIERFYPIFQSREARIVSVRLLVTEEETVKADVRLVADMPYVHRIHLLESASRHCIVAATLCTDKKFEQDWSSPGEARVLKLTETGGWDEQVVLRGIHKNHGMYRHRYKGGACVLVSGDEGVFQIYREKDALVTEHLLDTPVGDMVLFDVNGDGAEELIAIAPFHGDSLDVWRADKGRWAVCAHEGLAFGHAIWAGLVGESPCIVSCSRGGGRDTMLHLVAKTDGGIQFHNIPVDEGIGAANIAVESKGDAIVLYAANHGVGEVAKYTVRA